MRRFRVPDSLSMLTVFIYKYPLFCLFVFLSVVLMLITMALSFGAINYKWEKRCARMLIFCMIPVCSWMAYFLQPVFSPWLITALLWLIFPLSFLKNKIKAKIEKNIQVSKIKGWVCKQCKTVNEDLFLVCKKCKVPKQ
ncbi:MAG: hypothetical protein V1747_07865 [Candidatus Omnitrophota bacterium]